MTLDVEVHISAQISHLALHNIISLSSLLSSSYHLPYYTFTLDQQIPTWIPLPYKTLLHTLLQKDARARFHSCSDGFLHLDCTSGMTIPERRSISYDKLRRHLVFDELNTRMRGLIALQSKSMNVTIGENMLRETMENSSNNSINSTTNNNTIDDSIVDKNISLPLTLIYNYPSIQIPTLHEICIRIVAKCILIVANAIAENGGIRPKIPYWISSFSLFKGKIGILSELDRGLIMHYLLRQDRLHSPGVYRLFCSSTIEARSRRITDDTTRQYIGFTHQLQGHWEKDFLFMQIAAPLFGQSSFLLSSDSNSSTGNTTIGSDNSDSSINSGSSGIINRDDCTTEESILQGIISSINKLRPRFLVIHGSLTFSSSPLALDGNQQNYNYPTTHLQSLRKTMARLADSTPAIYVPGDNDVGVIPTVESLQAYRSLFGADYFGFWYGGMRGLVLNSSLMINPSSAVKESLKQDAWFTEEIEQAKLCSTIIIVFTYHPWYLHDVDEDDDPKKW